MKRLRLFSLLAVTALLAQGVIASLAFAQQTNDAPTDRPSTSRSSEVTVLSDTFENRDTGILDERPRGDDDLRLAYDDGHYEVDALPEDFRGTLGTVFGDDFSDVTIAIDAVLVGKHANEPGRYIYLGCRISDENTGYRFEFRPQIGNVILRKLNSSGGERMASGQLEDDEIPVTEAVRMELNCTGDTIIGRINGRQVVTASDSDLATGRLEMGAGIYTVNSGPVSADYDDLAVSVPIVEVPTPEPTPEVDRSALMAPVNQLREEATQRPPVYGPNAGGINQVNGGALDSKYAGLDLKNFVARITFENPPATTDLPRWDVGLGFRQDASGRHWRVIVRSDGTWSLAIAAEFPKATGVIENLNLGEGEQNTIELLVSDAVAYLLINDSYTAMMDVSAWQEAGDIWAGSGFFLDFATAGVITPYSDFTIWSLDQQQSSGGQATQPEQVTPTTESETPATEASGSPVAAESTTPSPEPTTESTDIDLDAAPTLDEIAGAALLNEPVAGPTSGTVTQGLGSIDIESANVDITNFYTTVRFSNPASVDDPDHSWDVVIGFWHRGGDDQIRLVVASDGTWSVAEGTSRPLVNGTVESLNIGPSRGNDIELAIEDGTGYLSINGEFAGAFEVPGTPQSGDIWIASGTFPENVQDGVETPFSDWTVWSLDPEVADQEATPAG